jgi:hypothetical protein
LFDIIQKPKSEKINIPKILFDGLDLKPGLARAFYNDLRDRMPANRIPKELKIRAGVISKNKKS